jgi:hypothetical protein
VEQGVSLRARSPVIACQVPNRIITGQNNDGLDLPDQLIQMQRISPGENYRHGRHHDEKRRKYAPDAAGVKPGETEGSFLDLAENDSRNQETGNDEEDIDAEVTARKPGWIQVKENDWQDRQGAQRIDGPETMG